MIRQVESRKLYIAIADIKDGKISYAKLNNFVVKLGENGNVRMYNENKNDDRSVPLENDFACFIETFEKSDLQPGMIVSTRSYETYLVLDNNTLVNKDDCVDLDEYFDDLTYKTQHNTEYDIIKVYKKIENKNLNEYLKLLGVDEIASINKIVQI